MILLIDTSTPTCKLTFSEGSDSQTVVWETGRDLAKGLLGFLQTEIEKKGKNWQDITGLGVYKGPGSFTGLRIGVTVFNSIADASSLPIVGATGDDWQNTAIEMLTSGKNDKIVLPEYGGEANITKPRK